jgi:hypothetical protein
MRVKLLSHSGDRGRLRAGCCHHTVNVVFVPVVGLWVSLWMWEILLGEVNVTWKLKNFGHDEFTQKFLSPWQKTTTFPTLEPSLCNGQSLRSRWNALLSNGASVKQKTAEESRDRRQSWKRICRVATIEIPDYSLRFLGHWRLRTLSSSQFQPPPLEALLS